MCRLCACVLDAADCGVIERCKYLHTDERRVEAAPYASVGVVVFRPYAHENVRIAACYRVCASVCVLLLATVPCSML